MSTLEKSFVGYQEEVDTLEKKLQEGIKSWSEKIVKATLENLGHVFSRLPKICRGTQNYPLPQRIADLLKEGEKFFSEREKKTKEILK